MTLFSRHIFSRHIGGHLAEYCDGRLAPAAAARIEQHLAECADCRAAVNDFRRVAGAMKQLTTLPAPDSIWLAIDEALGKPAVPIPVVSGFSRTIREGVSRTEWLRLATVAAMLLVVSIAGVWWWIGRGVSLPAGWQFADGHTGVSRDNVVQTGADSTVTLRVGNIGEVDVEPNTEVRLVAARDNLNRMALIRGRISARISAPPRLFFVDTPASTVVDLGCAYTMEADEDGDGWLRVTSGWASLEWAGRESLVPAGASCPTRPRVGPGTPAFDDASDALRRALLAFDFESGGDAAVDVVLRESRVRDTLTLWHLLSRVDEPARTRVFERLVELTPLPAGVEREKALRLDRETLDRWRGELAWTW